MLICEARDEGRSQTAQRGAGAPRGMRPRSGMTAPVTRSVRRPALPVPPGGGPSGRGSGRLYDAEERNEADGHFVVQTLKGRGFPGDLLCRVPGEGGRPFAAARFAHAAPERGPRGPRRGIGQRRRTWARAGVESAATARSTAHVPRRHVARAIPESRRRGPEGFFNSLLRSVVRLGLVQQARDLLCATAQTLRGHVTIVASWSCAARAQWTPHRTENLEARHLWMREEDLSLLAWIILGLVFGFIGYRRHTWHH